MFVIKQICVLPRRGGSPCAKTTCRTRRRIPPATEILTLRVTLKDILFSGRTFTSVNRQPFGLLFLRGMLWRRIPNWFSHADCPHTRYYSGCLTTKKRYIVVLREMGKKGCHDSNTGVIWEIFF